MYLKDKDFKFPFINEKGQVRYEDLNDKLEVREELEFWTSALLFNKYYCI